MMNMPDHFKKFANLHKLDADFLMCISDAAAIDLHDLYWILSLSDSGHVDYPMDDSDYPDINDGYDEKYEWDGEEPVRLSGFGRDVDYDIHEACFYNLDNEVRDGRLLGLTIDFYDSRVKNPKKLFDAVNFALNKFRDDLKIEFLSLCALRDWFYETIGLEEFDELSIRLPHLKKLFLNGIKINKIKFISAPRLEEIKVIGAGSADYDLSGIMSIKNVCIGDRNLSRLILPVGNSVERIIIGKGYLPTVRERNNGIGCSLEDLISNMEFSIKFLSFEGCGISKVDLSVCSNLQELNVSNNPINKLNLDWVPGLEYLNLQGTGIQNVDRRGLSKLKHVLVDTREPEPE